MNPPKIIKITLLNRDLNAPWFYALMEREDGKKYHIVWKYKSYKNWYLTIKTFNSIPFVVKVELKNIIDKRYINDYKEYNK